MVFWCCFCLLLLLMSLQSSSLPLLLRLLIPIKLVFKQDDLSFSESTARKMFPAPKGEKQQKQELSRYRKDITWKVFLLHTFHFLLKVNKIPGGPTSLWQNCFRLQGQNIKKGCKTKVLFFMLILHFNDYKIIDDSVLWLPLKCVCRFYRKLQKEIKADYSKNKKDIKDGVPPTFEEYWRYGFQHFHFTTFSFSDIWWTWQRTWWSLETGEQLNVCRCSILDNLITHRITHCSDLTM